MRFAALRALEAAGGAPEAEFGELAGAAARVCGVPIALITLIDGDRLRFKANHGLPELSETPCQHAFCAWAVLGQDAFEIADAKLDPRFAGSSLVTGEPAIRFYAGVPLRLSGGSQIGTLCVMDREPRRLNNEQREILGCLGRATVAALEARSVPPPAHAAHDGEDRLRRLYESTPALLYSIDREGRITAASDFWLLKMGYTREEVLGRKSLDFYTAESAEHARTVVQPAFFASGRCADIAFACVKKNGEIIDVLLSAVIERTADGEPLRTLTVVEDVTLRRRAENALSEQSRRLNAIIDATGAGSWQWNLQTGEIVVNDRWATILGYTPAQLAPISIATWTEHVHPEDGPRSEALLRRHVTGETDGLEVEVRLRHRDGRWIWIRNRGRLMTWTPDGKPEWMFGTNEDITHRRLEQEAVRKSSEFLDRTGRLAGVGGWAYDVSTRVFTCSDEIKRIHGLPSDHVLDLHQALKLCIRESRAPLWKAIRDAVRVGGSFDLELPHIRADGERIWVRAVGSADVVEGKLLRIVGALQDVTQRVAERDALRDANERVALATDGAGIGIWDWEIPAARWIWDPWMYRLFGLDALDDAGQPRDWRPRVHSEDSAAAERAIADALNGARALDVEFRILWDDGSLHHLRCSGRVSRDALGSAIRVAGAMWDVTAARRLAGELAQQHELLRVTLQSIGDAVITTDAAGAVVWLNPVAETMTGWLSRDAKGLPATRVFVVIDEETRTPAEHPVQACLTESPRVGATGRTVLISRDGTEFGIEDSAAAIRNERGELLGVVLVFHDVTERRRLSSEMSFRASHDALTGLINRSEFEIRLRRLLQRTHAENSAHVLLYLDLDQFKLVNDTCGHPVGDQVLVQVSKLIGDVVRHTDVIARLGGDEFAILLEHCSSEQGQRLAQQVCDRLDHFRYKHNDRRFRIGASIALVPIDTRWTTTAAIFQAADTSCYAAKESGRNRVHTWFDSDVAMRARQGQMLWTTRIENALDEDRFVLFAQRIAGLREPASGIHAEVLIRMRDNDGSLIPPGAFLPAAERFDLASRIDRWVVSKAIEWMKVPGTLERVENLSVNLSGQSVGDRNFHRWAVDVLSEAGSAICSRLCFEVTETAAVTNFADAAQFIGHVRARNVRVALDDFGAGASSFGYLKMLPVDYLKIDGQFILNLVDNPLDEVTVRCFVDVAKIVGVKTVAEFVTTPAILERLRLLGVDYVQGFLLHQPVAIDELLQSVLLAAAT